MANINVRITTTDIHVRLLLFLVSLSFLFTFPLLCTALVPVDGRAGPACPTRRGYSWLRLGAVLNYDFEGPS